MTTRWRAPLALIVLAGLFACLKGRTPTDASTNGVRFDLKAQVSGGSTLHVTVVYLDQTPNSESVTPVMLLDRRITVAAGSQDLPLTIDVTRCLADPQHIQGPTCELLAGVVLEQNGQEVDSVGIGPITVTPGQTVHDSTSLVAVGAVHVFPHSASLTPGAITVLHDSVFSPSETYLPNATVRWTSADTTVAKVNQNGAVTGVAAGQTTVTASSGGQSDFATITVTTGGTTGGLTFPGLGAVNNTVTFSATAGGSLPVNGLVPVASSDTTTVTNLVATITPSSANQWLVAYVSDSSFGSRVKHRPNGFHAQTIRKQTSGSGVTTPATVDVVPTTTSLAAGTYTATVTVSGDGNRSAAFQVAYTITAAAPALSFSPNPVQFSQYAYSGALANEVTAFARNTGTGGSLGTITENGSVVYTGADANWLNVIGVGPDTVALQPNTASLHLGTDTARMSFTMAGASKPDTLVIEVSSAVTYQKVVLGAAFGCGLTTTSMVYCWGGSGLGELGDGGGANDLAIKIPVRALVPNSPSDPIIDVEAGAAHACALTQSGATYCWGSNNRGQVGVGSSATTIPTPTVVTGKTYGQISLGANHTCAIEGVPPLAGANYLDCWGDNTVGEFGNNLPTGTAQTSPVITYQNFVAVSAGNNYTCGITNLSVSANLYCAGANNFGQLGNGYSGSPYSTFQPSQVLTPAGGPATVSSVSAGNGTTCAVDNAGNGYCWGDNTLGEVGNDGVGTPILTPTLLPNTWTSISTGVNSVCGIASNADYCWGYNNYGQIGIGTMGNTIVTVPTAVIGSGALFTEFTVGATSQSACYITSGAVQCFGYDSNSQLGDGGIVTLATDTPTLMVDQPGPSFLAPSRVIRRPKVYKARSH